MPEGVLGEQVTVGCVQMGLACKVQEVPAFNANMETKNCKYCIEMC